jgi:hypothetical protein
MSYSPYLISNYATGFDRELQPWLLPNDAFTDLLDGYVYRGVTNSRDGYSGFANGLKSTYTESRMVHNVSTSYTVIGVIDGVNDTYAIQVTPPVIPNSLTITGSNPVQVVTDDGAGNLVGAGTGTVNYVTGAIALVFTAPPAVASTITVAYGNFSVGSGSAGPYANTVSNIPLRRGTITITAGAQSATDDGVGGFITTPVGGSGTVNYATGAISITFNAVVAIGVPITISFDYHPGLPVMGIMNFYPTNNIRQLIVADTRYVNRYNPATDVLDDIPAGTYTGTSKDFWSWVNYADPSSVPRLLFSNGVVGDVIQVYNGTTIVNYAPTFTPGTLNARQMFNNKDRLVLFQTIEAGTLFPRRIRISGTGADSDNFDNTAVGAGFIDIPDNTWFFGAAFNRDDILFFTEEATWTLKYTGNDVTPFTLQKLDGSRGSGAAFSVISYLNRTMAASRRGLIICDGYQVDRMDNNIPDFTFENIDGGNFDHCFSGFFDEDRDVYTLYPSKGVVKPPLVPVDGSDRILVTNFEEDNYAVYRIPLSCVGNFQSAFTLLWSDLTAANGFPNWDAMSIKIGNWNAFPYTKAVPIAIGGGHKGEIWRLNDAESEDNPQMIRAITVIDNQTIRVTTDWNNYEVGDYIVFEKVGGMVEINDKQGRIKSPIVTAYNTFDVDFGQSHGGFSAYTSGGETSRVIPFEAISKKLNPWIDSDKKVRCGWIYFYVGVSETDLTDWDEDSTPVPAQLKIEVLVNNNEAPDFSNPQFTYLVDCSAINGEKGGKKWVKIWINQVGQFLQFKMSNEQAGAEIRVHAMMPGFQPIGRLI